MTLVEETAGRALVDQVRAAARAHNSTWEAMIPDAFTIDLAAEAAEEAAYTIMAG